MVTLWYIKVLKVREEISNKIPFREHHQMGIKYTLMKGYKT